MNDTLKEFKTWLAAFSKGIENGAPSDVQLAEINLHFGRVRPADKAAALTVYKTVVSGA